MLQHYMLNDEINEQLVASANVEEGDLVLEIGPGTGSLTNVLIDAGATVLAIEKVRLIGLFVAPLFFVINLVGYESFFFFLICNI